MFKFSVVILLSLLSTAAIAADQETFSPIFDGKSLAGWQVVPAERTADWSVRDGLLIGNSNGTGSDIIWNSRDLTDFELKLSYRLKTQGNSGIHIRGRLGESKSHRVKGYHADFGHVGIGDNVLGAWDYHGVPRGPHLVRRGQRVVIDAQGKSQVTEIDGALTTDDIRQDDWNEVHVVVRGFRFYFTINGKMASEVIDNEVAKRIERGGIGLQLHGGKPMQIEFRDIQLADLSDRRSSQ